MPVRKEEYLSSRSEKQDNIEEIIFMNEVLKIVILSTITRKFIELKLNNKLVSLRCTSLKDQNFRLSS